MRTTKAQAARSNFHTFIIGDVQYRLSERKIAQMFNKCYRTLSRRLRRGWTLFQALDLEAKPKDAMTDTQVKQKQLIKKLAQRGLRR